VSKRERLENLATFIGLRAAHEILIRVTNKPESNHHLEQEADNYGNLSFDLAKGNWNQEDILEIKELAKKCCNKKLRKYHDIDDKKFDMMEKVIENVLVDLGVENT
jgi:hypothetical protein